MIFVGQHAPTDIDLVGKINFNDTNLIRTNKHFGDHLETGKIGSMWDGQWSNT